MKKKQPKVQARSTKETPPARAWKVGDRVTKKGMQGPYEITRISPDGSEADLCLVGTNFRALPGADRAQIVPDREE